MVQQVQQEGKSKSYHTKPFGYSFAGLWLSNWLRFSHFCVLIVQKKKHELIAKSAQFQHSLCSVHNDNHIQFRTGTLTV